MTKSQYEFDPDAQPHQELQPQPAPKPKSAPRPAQPKAPVDNPSVSTPLKMTREITLDWTP